MEQALSILLIEDDIEACNQLAGCIKKQEDLTFITCTNNTNRALEMVLVHQPNIILLDLELHLGSGNGISFLNDLKKLELKQMPYILITTQNTSEVILAEARDLGADFTLTKYSDNYSAQYVIETIQLMRPAIYRKNSMSSHDTSLSLEEQEELIERQIKMELGFIGIKSNSLGFQYLTDAIQIIRTQRVFNLPKLLAPKYKKSPASIERAMQNAIKSAWERTAIDDLLHYYTAYVDPNKGYPTTMELVYYYADKINDTLKLK